MIIYNLEQIAPLLEYTYTSNIRVFKKDPRHGYYKLTILLITKNLIENKAKGQRKDYWEITNFYHKYDPKLVYSLITFIRKYNKYYVKL